MKNFLFLSILLLPIAVFADPLTYKVEGDTVTVVDCDESFTGELVIPSTFEGKDVTRIGRNAFYKASLITGVIIPNSVTVINDYAFAECSRLQNLIIPDSVKIIESSTFFKANNLENITIGEGVESIRPGTFQNCSGLKKIIVDSNNISYSDQDGVLYDRTKSRLIRFPPSNSKIFTIPEGVKTISFMAFQDCEDLETLIMPDSITSIGRLAFHNCSSLEEIIIPDSVKIIERSSFRDCRKLKSVRLSNNISRIYAETFYKCNSLVSISIPDSVISIEGAAFRDCSNLTSIDIPDSVTSIGESAFNSCLSLSKVIIPTRVKVIGQTAFSDCKNLKKIEFEGAPPFIGAHAFDNISPEAEVFINPGVSGFGEKFLNLPVVLKAKTAVHLNGNYSNGKNVEKTESTTVSFFTHFKGDEIFYTLDGSKPTFTSTPYTAPFQLAESATIRAIAYSADFTSSLEAEPVKFRLLTTYSLNVGTSGGGVAIIDPPDGPYVEGSEVTLTAKAEGDWKFIGWQGDSTSSETSISITMDKAKSITPIFGTNVKVNAIGGGNVIQTPANPVPYGSTVSFKAEPEDGNYFFRWAGETTGNENPIQLKITKSNPVISGLFAPSPVGYKIKITSFNSHASPFSLTFETESDSSYKIEASHDLQKWSEIGEVQGTGNSVKFIERRKALFPKQFYRVKLVE